MRMIKRAYREDRRLIATKRGPKRRRRAVRAIVRRRASRGAACCVTINHSKLFDCH